MSAIQFRRYQEWTMVYKDGVLQRAGDHHLADEWLQALCNVEVVEDEAGLCMDENDAPIPTLALVEKRESEYFDRLMVAKQKREAAAALIIEAEKLESER